MCLIAYAPKDKSQLPRAHLVNAYNRNDDAWGIMRPGADGKLFIKKDITGFQAFESHWKEVPNKTPVCVHFRFATAGSNGVEMAHPFLILTMEEHGIDLGLMHN